MTSKSKKYLPSKKSQKQHLNNWVGRLLIFPIASEVQSLEMNWLAGIMRQKEIQGDGRCWEQCHISILRTLFHCAGSICSEFSSDSDLANRREFRENPHIYLQNTDTVDRKQLGERLPSLSPSSGKEDYRVRTFWAWWQITSYLLHFKTRAQKHFFP